VRGRGVTHVVMEASGVYTDPVYYALRELDFTEVMVINPAHAKRRPPGPSGAARTRGLARHDRGPAR
jgi:transposase